MRDVPAYRMAVHGGAGRLPDRSLRPPARGLLEDGARAALAAGEAVLAGGGRALDAVQAAVCVLEDAPCFNAGRGAVLCAGGEVELSASVMDGRDRKVGAMVGLTRARNPVRAAATLLDHRHALLFGASADAFAEDAGLELRPAEYFVTEERRTQWQRLGDRRHVHLDHTDVDEVEGTVGAVALDRHGHFAAATSTGGMTNQLAGRVGDSPVVGAGTWADVRCAVSATGTGDVFLRLAFARRVADRIELAGESVAMAVTHALAEVAAHGGHGGCVAIGPDGAIAMPFDTEHMVRGSLRGGEAPSVAIEPD